MKVESYSEKWKLDTLFKGGDHSMELVELITRIETELKELAESTTALSITNEALNEIVINNILVTISGIHKSIAHVASFATCLLAEDPKNQSAAALQGKVASLKTESTSILLDFQRLLSIVDQEIWDTLLENESLSDQVFILTEWRENAASSLSAEEETLLAALSVDGYHSWGGLYRSIVNNLQIPITINGSEKEYSIGQATNLRSHSDEKVRLEAFIALENTWTALEDIVAHILNHITGFRIQADKKQGIMNGLEKPLKDNRIKAETLQAMWQVINRNKKPFANYLDHKAKLAQNTQMPSYDFWAPFNESSTSINYEEAVSFILQHFRQFGPELESFAQTAFKEGWVEAENRKGKSAIAFCAGFPLTGESRIFLTYDGSMTSLLTLAHELGHAFHNHAMKSVDGLNQTYSISTAETASTFTEMIVLDAAIKTSESTEQKLFLLDEEIKRSVMNFMNIHSRFLFEERLYEARKAGMVFAKQLNEMMQNALTEGYAGSMSHLPIHSWIAVPHFYITSTPFYNFPYTFGYLFSISIYAKAREEGKEFEQRYLALLRDTGRMTVEELAQKHLGEDITEESFWEKGMALCVKDAEEFIRLSSGIHSS